MEAGNSHSSLSNYQALHDLYQSVKKMSKTSQTEQEKNVSPEVKKEANDLIDRAIEKIDEMTMKENFRNLRLIAMKITMFYERSKLLMSLGDEAISRETLITALNIINDVVSEPEVIFLALRIINHYSYLLTKQGDFETSRRILEYSEMIYKDTIDKSKIIQFYTSDDLFVPEEIASAASETNNKLERLVTNNLQMLSFVYTKLELHDKFAECHHVILKRQLEMGDEDVATWAIKSAKLSSYFLSKNRFMEARHHLSAAIHVLYEYEKDLGTMETSSEKNEKLNDLKRKLADVAKCWVKYGLFLFSVSKTSMVANFCGERNQVLDKLWTLPFKNYDDKNIVSNADKTTFQTANAMKKDASFSDVHRDNTNLSVAEGSSSVNSTFPTGTVPEITENILNENSMDNRSLNLDEYQGPKLVFDSLTNLFEYENQVAASFVETTAQARALFLFTHGWLKEVKTFYSLNEHPLEYVNAILDLSELYRYLAFYEEDIESQYAVQKLRADALETLCTVLREIRPECYMSVSVELLRELAEVQLEMMGLNLRRICSAKEKDAIGTNELTIHKMDALADLHSKLEQFPNNFSHNIVQVEKKCFSETVESNELNQFFV